jgi:hypothetical protein
MILVFPSAPVEGFGNGTPSGGGVVQPDPIQPGDGRFLESLLNAIIPYRAAEIPNWLFWNIPANEREEYRRQWPLLSEAERKIVAETYPMPVHQPARPADLGYFIGRVNSSLTEAANNIRPVIQETEHRSRQTANAVLEHIQAALVLAREIQ